MTVSSPYGAQGTRRRRGTRARAAAPGTPGAPARAADPFDPAWVATGLRALAERALAQRAPGATGATGATGDGPPGSGGSGRSPGPGAAGHSGSGGSGAAARSADDLLLEALWPWALRTARAQAARLPPGADRDAVHGETLWEVYQAVRRIDWERYEVWPAFLKSRLRAAWSAAARAEDPLTRGERQARTAYLARVEAETQRLGRTLTSAERYAIARRLRPAGGTVPVVAGRRLLPAAGPGSPAAVLQAATAQTTAVEEEDPAVLLQRAWLRRAVRVWVAHDLPPDLRREVSVLLERDEADRIGHALLRRLTPYAGALHRRIDD